MDFTEYQTRAKGTRTYPAHGTGKYAAITYCTLGLTGEAGEVANKVKKLLRDEDTIDLRTKILDELGDVLWYLAMLADEVGAQIDTIATENLKKLKRRQMENKLKGAGDDR